MSPLPSISECLLFVEDRKTGNEKTLDGPAAPGRAIHRASLPAQRRRRRSSLHHYSEGARPLRQPLAGARCGQDAKREIEEIGMHSFIPLRVPCGPGFNLCCELATASECILKRSAPK